LKEQNTSSSGTRQAPKPKILVLNKDLFFGVKIGNALRAQGFEVMFRPATDAFVTAARAERPRLGIIDLNLQPDWSAIAELVAEEGQEMPILVFGSHLDVDGLRAAKAAGVTRVVSNGEFHRNMIELVNRYGRRDA
jgi:ActR/RegA family two-component response regulator